MFFIQGLGYIPIDSRHLPKDLYRMNKIELLDLLIFKFNDKTWIQQNYKSGKIRIIIKTTDIQDKDQMEKECSEFVLENIEKVFANADAILQKQDEIKMMFCIA